MGGGGGAGGNIIFCSTVRGYLLGIARAPINCMYRESLIGGKNELIGVPIHVLLWI